MPAGEVQDLVYRKAEQAVRELCRASPVAAPDLVSREIAESSCLLAGALDHPLERILAESSADGG